MTKSNKKTTIDANNTKILQKYRTCHPLIANNQIDFAKILNSMDGENIQKDLAHLWECWKYVLGSDTLANYAIPLGHKKRTLIIGCADSIQSQEIHMHEPEILERVNAFIYKKYFLKIEVKVIYKEKNLNDIVTHTQNTLAEPASTTHLTGKFLPFMDKTTAITKCYVAFVQNNRANQQLSDNSATQEINTSPLTQSEINLTNSTPTQDTVAKPKITGKYLANMPKNSALAKCYAKFVQADANTCHEKKPHSDLQPCTDLGHQTKYEQKSLLDFLDHDLIDN